LRCAAAATGTLDLGAIWTAAAACRCAPSRSDRTPWSNGLPATCPCALRIGRLTLTAMCTLWSFPFWTMLAGWAQVGALVVTAVFVWRYLKATEGLRTETAKQVDAANDQLEAQIRPAIVVRAKGSPHGLELVNSGKGPALDVVCSPAERGSEGSRRWSDAENFNSFVADRSFIEAGVARITNIRTSPEQGLGGVPVLNGMSLQCQYESLSGRTYWTVVDFDKASGNTVIDMRFSDDAGHQK
jgi:hypothetical protein